MIRILPLRAFSRGGLKGDDDQDGAFPLSRLNRLEDCRRFTSFFQYYNVEYALANVVFAGMSVAEMKAIDDVKCVIRTDIPVDRDQCFILGACYEFHGDTSSWSVIHGYNRYKNLVIIPRIKGYEVRSIDLRAFEGATQLEKVVIPEGVQTIGARAFDFCKKLTSVTIPSTVREISDEAFYECEKLETVVIRDGVEIIGANAFKLCGLTTVSIPSSIKKIGYGSFWRCKNLSSVTIAEGVEEIGQEAFLANIAPIVIPSSVKSIGPKALPMGSRRADGRPIDEGCFIDKSTAHTIELRARGRNR